jgi:hypothetical protein
MAKKGPIETRAAHKSIELKLRYVRTYVRTTRTVLKIRRHQHVRERIRPADPDLSHLQIPLE